MSGLLYAKSMLGDKQGWVMCQFALMRV